MRLALVATLCLILTACGGVEVTEVPRPNFDPAVASFALEGDGQTEVSGSAFARQRGGGVVSCAGSDVWLLPDTPFFRWATTRVVTTDTTTSALIGGGADTSADWPIATRLQDTMEYARQSQCDIDGRFRFPAVPAGRYFVATVITWTVGTQQGGVALEPVMVTNQDTLLEVTVQL